VCDVFPTNTYRPPGLQVSWARGRGGVRTGFLVNMPEPETVVYIALNCANSRLCDMYPGGTDLLWGTGDRVGTGLAPRGLGPWGLEKD
jgi:hypothetical protein